MIYLSFADCEKSYRSQHNAAYELLNDMLSELGFEQIKILRDNNGRPYSECDDVDFSVSHTDGLAAVALITSRVSASEKFLVFPSEGKRIGLDIESEDRMMDIDDLKKLATRFLNADVSSAEEFYRRWTQNEAYGKMTGEGVINNSHIPCHRFTLKIERNDRKFWLSIACSI